MIGIQLVRLLVESGAEVRVASLDDSSRVDENIEFLHGNLTDWSFCRAITEGMDYVFHLAGVKGSVGIGNSKAATFFVPHIIMNTFMMEAARQAKVEKYLYTSSIAVYHPTQSFVEDKAWDGPPHPSDKYAAWAKRMGELQAEAYQIEYEWENISIVRPANVYGPFDNFSPETAMVIPALISRVASGENPLTVWGDGTAIRDFIFCRDVAEGMLLALEHGSNSLPINLGSGEGISIKQVVSTIINCFDAPPEVVWDTSKATGQNIRVMDVSRAKDLIGFKAQTSLQQGIETTVDWYMSNRTSAGNRYNIFDQSAHIN